MSEAAKTDGLRKIYERSIQTCDGAYAHMVEGSTTYPLFDADDYLRRIYFFRSAYGAKLVDHANWRNAVKEAAQDPEAIMTRFITPQHFLIAALSPVAIWGGIYGTFWLVQAVGRAL